MPSRRIEKVIRELRAALSEIIQYEISDPRVQGIISVTRVDASPDLKNAKVYLSMLDLEEKKQELCLAAINHAAGFIRSQLAQRLEMKSCPALTFFLDRDLPNRLRTMEILNRITDELQHATEPDPEPKTEGQT